MLGHHNQTPSFDPVNPWFALLSGLPPTPEQAACILDICCSQAAQTCSLRAVIVVKQSRAICSGTFTAYTHSLYRTMGALTVQLQQLQTELDALDSEVKEAARAVLEAEAAGAKEQPFRKELWQQLVKKEAMLLQQRQALQNMLSSTGVPTFL